ncbi:MAG: hypothetical protein ACFCUI_09470 [Bernardetiaceae bacterium]
MIRWGFLCCCIFLCLSGGGLHAQTKSEKAEGQWLVWTQKQGVEIYVQHRKSAVDTKYNTLVRLRNNNDSEFMVNFSPAFGCLVKTEKSRETSDGGSVSISKSTLVTYQHGEVKVVVYPRSSVTLLAYRPCKGDIPHEINFNAFQVRRR